MHTRSTGRCSADLPRYHCPGGWGLGAYADAAAVLPLVLPSPHHLAVAHRHVQVRVLNPGVYPQECAITWGLLRAFMQQINATFPHPQHTLVNNAVRAANLGYFAEQSCFEVRCQWGRLGEVCSTMCAMQERCPGCLKQRGRHCVCPWVDHLLPCLVLIAHDRDLMAHLRNGTVCCGDDFAQQVNVRSPNTRYGRVTLLCRFALAACCLVMQAQMPNTTDIIILEQHSPMSDYFGDDAYGLRTAEHLLARLQGPFRDTQPHPPAVIILNTLWVTRYPALTTDPDELAGIGRTTGCIMNPSGCAASCAGDLFSTIIRDSYNPRGSAALLEDHLGGFADFYGVTMISMRSLYYSFIRDGTLEAQGMTECTMVGGLQQDNIHPRDLGCVLMADLLVGVLADAEGHVARQVSRWWGSCLRKYCVVLPSTCWLCIARATMLLLGSSHSLRGWDS